MEVNLGGVRKDDGSGGVDRVEWGRCRDDEDVGQMMEVLTK